MTSPCCHPGTLFSLKPLNDEAFKIVDNPSDQHLATQLDDATPTLDIRRHYSLAIDYHAVTLEQGQDLSSLSWYGAAQVRRTRAMQEPSSSDEENSRLSPCWGCTVDCPGSAIRQRSQQTGGAANGIIHQSPAPWKCRSAADQVSHLRETRRSA